MTTEIVNPEAVAIAQDVLAQLGQYGVFYGQYLRGQLPHDVNVKREDSVQNHVDVVAKNCRVCALGAAFLSMVRLYNAVNMETLMPYIDDTHSVFMQRNSITCRLNTYFSSEQLDMIESAFERCQMGHTASPTRKYDAMLFVDNENNPKERLKKIMENIVENGGVFNPPPAQF